MRPIAIFLAAAAVTTAGRAAESDPAKRAVIENCGRVIGNWSPEETSDPATLVQIYLADYDLETPSGVDQAIDFIHGQMEFVQHKLEELRNLPKRALQQQGGRGTIAELDGQLRQIAILAVILKNAKSTFLGRRAEN